MRAIGRRRALTISAACSAAVAAVLAVVFAVVLPLSHAAPAAARGPAGAGVVTAGGGGRLPAGGGDTVCGDVRFDKAELPGRTATPDNGDQTDTPANPDTGGDQTPDPDTSPPADSGGAGPGT